MLIDFRLVCLVQNHAVLLNRMMLLLNTKYLIDRPLHTASLLPHGTLIHLLIQPLPEPLTERLPLGHVWDGLHVHIVVLLGVLDHWQIHAWLLGLQLVETVPKLWIPLVRYPGCGSLSTTGAAFAHWGAFWTEWRVVEVEAGCVLVK